MLGILGTKVGFLNLFLGEFWFFLKYFSKEIFSKDDQSGLFFKYQSLFFLVRKYTFLGLVFEECAEQSIFLGIFQREPKWIFKEYLSNEPLGFHK